MDELLFFYHLHCAPAGFQNALLTKQCQCKDESNMNRFLLQVASSIVLLGAIQATASVSVTDFSSTNTSVGGVGDVTITFDTDEVNFGPAGGGGWAVTATLPAGMSTGGAYSAEAPCSSTTIELTPVSGFTPYCSEISGMYIVANQAGLGSSTVLGANSYTLTIRNVTNPNSPGEIFLSELSVWDATSGGRNPPGGATSLNLSTYPIEITSVATPAATPVPTLPLFGLLTLGGLLGLFGLRKLKQ